MRPESIRPAERRRQLVAQAAAQRHALAVNLAPWRPRLAVVDQGLAAIRYVRGHPLLMGGGALLLAALRRPAGCGWLRRRLAWRAARRV